MGSRWDLDGCRVEYEYQYDNKWNIIVLKSKYKVYS